LAQDSYFLGFPFVYLTDELIYSLITASQQLKLKDFNVGSHLFDTDYFADAIIPCLMRCTQVSVMEIPPDNIQCLVATNNVRDCFAACLFLCVTCLYCLTDISCMTVKNKWEQWELVAEVTFYTNGSIPKMTLLCLLCWWKFCDAFIIQFNMMKLCIVLRLL